MTSNTTSGPDTTRPVLKLQITSLDFGGLPILGELSLQVKRGETLALVGPSGIGKTSLLRIISGLERDYRGQCHVEGVVAMVFQEPTVLPWRSLRDNICIASGVSVTEADQALADVGLAGREDDFPSQLSLGQQRRLSLARAFAVKPDLLLMDEPFVSLDPELVAEMMELFATLRAAHQVTTILVTHVAKEARKLAGRIVTLGGTPAKVISDVQNKGAYFQLSASGVTSSKS
ncbi:ABC transporter ATP-binding protein [Litoreibacter halocynthiae]|uniref:ABC transporter ATP-binding protein n=1 Tax=Litoreibacter halocynthiae TaxID=1242689 RepID=UPI0010633B05|nr:ABC transporter ATP-binding protein [Litoreibacter halocynthiae]